MIFNLEFRGFWWRYHWNYPALGLIILHSTISDWTAGTAATVLHWFSLFKHRIQCPDQLTSAQPIAGDRGSIFACSAVTVDTGTRGHSQGSLPKWSIHESWRGGYLCGDLLRGRYLDGDLIRGRYLGGDLLRGRYSLYKVKVLLWLWNGALNSDTWYRFWHLKSPEESTRTVKTHSCWAPPTKFPLRRVLCWYFTFGHLFRRKASCRTTKCFIAVSRCAHSGFTASILVFQKVPSEDS